MFYQQPQSGPLQPDSRWQGAGLASITTFDQSERDVFGALKLSRAGTILRAVRTGGQGLSQNGGSNFWTTAAANPLIGAGASFSFALTFALNSLGQTNRYLMAERDGVGGQSALIYGYVANTVELFSISYSGSDPRAGSGIVVNDLLTHTVVYTYDGTTYAGYLDGKRIFSVARTFSLNPMTSGVLGGSTPSATDVSDITVLQHARFSKGLTDLAARELSGNPWALYYDEDEEVEGLFAPATGPDVTLALSGQTIAASAGTLAISSARALSGQSATTNAGTLTPARSKALTGSAGTASAAAVVPLTAKAMTGQAATAAQGSPSVSGSAGATLSGQALTASPGSVGASVTVALAGQSASVQQALLSPSRAIVIVGRVATGVTGSVSVPSVATTATFNQSTLMRATALNKSVEASETSIAASSTMRSTLSLSALMRNNPINATATMSSAALNRTANLI